MNEQPDFQGRCNRYVNDSALDFRWARLQELSAMDWHAVLAARTAVFIVEQNCPYQDADALDALSWHLLGYRQGALAAYLRVVDPGQKPGHADRLYTEPSIGRVLTISACRGLGLAKALLQEGLSGCARLFPGQGIRISAQAYLQKFYHDFGFQPVGNEYLEDGIPHVEMRRD
jgi:ElaA protein